MSFPESGRDYSQHSHRRKFARAQSNFKQIGDFLHAALTVRVDADADGQGEVVVEALVPIRATIEAMFGDAVHNLRSSLDHVVYAISAQSPEATPDRLRKVAFPFARHSDEPPFVAVANVLADHPALSLLPEDACAAAVACAVPFDPADVDPGEATLSLLNRLDNLDKHMAIQIVVTAAQMTGGTVIGAKGLTITRAHLEEGRPAAVAIGHVGAIDPRTIRVRADLHLDVPGVSDLVPLRDLFDAMAVTTDRVLLDLEGFIA